MFNPSTKLLICSPILHIDEYAVKLAESLTSLGNAGVPFMHLVVGPERNRELVKSVFHRTHSIFVAECVGTRGVFDAVVQGFNYGLEHFHPTHLSYINSDDLLEAGFGEAVARCVPGEPQLITGKVNWIGEDGSVSDTIAFWPYNAFLPLLFEMWIPPFTQQGTIVSVDVWEKTGGFDLNYKLISDTVFWHKILEKNLARRVFVPSVVASYRIRSGQFSADRRAVHKEHEVWSQTLGHGLQNRGKRLIASVLMRFLNSPIYFRRLMSGRRMRTEDAMKFGGF